MYSLHTHENHRGKIKYVALWIGRNNKGDTKSGCITFLSRG